MLIIDYLPTFIFSKHFSNACISAMQDYAIDASVHTKFLSAVLDNFQSMFQTLQSNSSLTASQIHMQNIARLRPQVAEFRSHKSCFCCLMRMPEKVLDCGHALCNICIKTYGRRSSSTKYNYYLSSCVLCASPHRASDFQFVPPSAGIRILSIDGGGIRGVISLIFLIHIEQALSNFGCSLREHFDLICGTSAGT